MFFLEKLESLQCTYCDLSSGFDWNGMRCDKSSRFNWTNAKDNGVQSIQLKPMIETECVCIPNKYWSSRFDWTKI